MNIDPDALLSALRRPRGKGRPLKHLFGQLHLGHAQRNPLRRALSNLLKGGRASYDGHVYRELRAGADDGDRRKDARDASRPPSRRTPAVMLEGARMHRNERADVVRKPGAEVTGVIHLKAEGYGFVSPLLANGGRENDLFIPPHYGRGGPDGDAARAQANPGRDSPPAGGGLPGAPRPPPPPPR